MDIYIVRHGVAADLDNEIAEESYRYLTIHGRNHCRIVAQRLKDMKINLDAVFSSPLVRALQTAELFSSVMKYDGEIRTAIELIGGSSFNRFKQFIIRNSHFERIALFGHAPDVNIFSTGMITENPKNVSHINFKNSSVCKVEFNPDTETGKFIWFLNSDNMKLVEASAD